MTGKDEVRNLFPGVAAHLYGHGPGEKGEPRAASHWLAGFERWLNDLGTPDR